MRGREKKRGMEEGCGKKDDEREGRRERWKKGWKVREEGRGIGDGK